MHPIRLHRSGAHAPGPDPQLYGRVPEHALSDSRLTDADLRVLAAACFLARLTFPRLQVKQRQLAEEARQAERTVRDSLARLEGAGYLRRERDYSVRGAPHSLVFQFEYRGPFKLESESASGSQSASNRRPAAACNRRRAAACNRRGAAGPTLFERGEEREKDARAPAACAGTHPPAAAERTEERTPEGPSEPRPDWSRWRAIFAADLAAAQKKTPAGQPDKSPTGVSEQRPDVSPIIPEDTRS